jgi:hypothetical protein
MRRVSIPDAGRQRLAVLARVSMILAAVLLLALAPSSAGAHAMPTSSVLLDIQPHDVGGEIGLPIDRLAIAVGRPLTPAQAGGAQRDALAAYARSHISATGADGRAWTVAVSPGHVAQVNGKPNLVMALKLTPPDGTVTRFDPHYDVIINQLLTHRAIATIRTQFKQGTTASDPVTLGTFEWNHQTLSVDAGGGSWLHGFTSMVHLGVEHIATGSDHLLFLLMLLIPAPLVVRGRHWRRRDSARESFMRVVHVVTAFAIGHSITLALAALGVVHPPSQVVESLIAVSIFVSAIHALRPLIPGGEALIAVGFGLVHGLAFATLLGGMGLHGAALVSSLLGFNLGIELTQLLVVALMMPSLYLLSRTGLYTPIRTGAVLFGVVLSSGWLLDRTGILAADPFAAVSTAVVDHPFAVPAAFALLAGAALLRRIPRPTTESATA